MSKFNVGDIVKEDGVNSVIMRVTDTTIAGFTADGGLLYYSDMDDAEETLEQTGWTISNFRTFLANLKEDEFNIKEAFDNSVKVEAKALNLEEYVVISAADYKKLLAVEKIAEWYKGYAEGLEYAIDTLERRGNE